MIIGATKPGGLTTSLPFTKDGKPDRWKPGEKYRNDANTIEKSKNTTM